MKKKLILTVLALWAGFVVFNLIKWPITGRFQLLDDLVTNLVATIIVAALVWWDESKRK